MPSAPDSLSDTAHQIAELILERIDAIASVARTTSVPDGRAASFSNGHNEVK